ncbi:hypothetical protein GGR57DRAFT_488824 [Xylariaceae sp. FL1272]|nr:hypothetical protein GGR57DRAFT_488824 [Xylariaceae sp. FL1272]
MAAALFNSALVSYVHSIYIIKLWVQTPPNEFLLRSQFGMSMTKRAAVMECFAWQCWSSNCDNMPWRRALTTVLLACLHTSPPFSRHHRLALVACIRKPVEIYGNLRILYIYVV